MAQTTLINDIYGVVGSQGEIADLNIDGKNMGLVRATTGPGGGIASRRRGTIVSSSSGRPTGLPRDRLIELLSWMRPTHLPILQPQEHIGMTPITSGVVTISHDPTVGEFSGSSIKLAVSGAGAFTNVRLPLPAAVEAGVSSRPRRAAGAVHYRVRCSNWQAVTRLYISLAQDGGVTNYYLGNLINNNKSPFAMTNPAYADRWNNQWRTLVMQSRQFSGQGAPAPWGTSPRYYDGIDGVLFTAVATEAVDLWVDRIYSPDWPCAVVTPIFDGWYASARNAAVNDFLPRGWGCGGSANTVETSGIYPSYAHLCEMSDLGFDVFAHGHVLSGSSAAPLGSATTEATFGPILSAQRRAMFGAGVDPVGMRWHQWLQNLGNGTFDVAAHLRMHGIDAARADTIDGQWGINPHNADFTTANTFNQSSSWIGRRGRFNRPWIQSYYNIAVGAGYSAAPTDPTRPTLASEIDYACRTGQLVTTYDHQILESPSSSDVSVDYHRERVADWEARERAGELLVLNPTMVEYLTYWRPDDVYVRWDGEWVYRNDPTRIAF